ncbi:MAG: prephenate dehydrogenase/arogenate dehydrogenase family protein [Alphaproteobacteria bacterium]
MNIAIIGVGLIGSSLDRAIRQKTLHTTHLYDEIGDVRTSLRAHQLGHHVYDAFADAIKNADLIILATPVGTFADLVPLINDHAPKGCILSDVGSVKSSVANSFQQLRKDLRPVPAHPIAGTEKSGPEHGFAHLFENRWCIVSPTPSADQEAVDIICNLWAQLGSLVEIMDAERHDLVMAITSHIPHLVAFSTVGTADHLEQVTASEVIKYSAGGFDSFTRLAGSDPIMWRDVFLHNREAVLEMLARFVEDLVAVQRMIRFEDADGLEKLFRETREIRRKVIASGTSRTEG